MIRVGTSGWVYPHWRGLFYPEGLSSARWLECYAEAFDTVEINHTFYRLPTAKAVDGWRGRTPSGFVFALKGSRFLTHVMRLAPAPSSLERFFDPLARLREKLGVILWQLPPQWSRPDPERLDRFARRLPRSIRHVFEFRHPAWYTEDVCAVLDRHGMAFCEHDGMDVRPPRSTGGFRYQRFHGRTAPHAGRYGREVLRSFARDLDRWHASGKNVYVYFNNDTKGHALYDALDLKALLNLPYRSLGEAAAMSHRA